MDKIKEKILGMLSKHSYSEKLIYEFLSDDKEVRDALSDLIEKGEVVKLKKELYLPSSLKLVKGKIVSIKANYSFASVEGQDEDVYIDNKNLESAFIDDIVYLERVKYSARDEYRVFSIIQRARKQLVGEIKDLFGNWVIDVKDVSSKNMMFKINPTPLKLFEGNIALCHITKQTKNVTYVDVVKIIGNKNEPGVDVSRIILKYNADIEFPNEVREQVNSIPQELDPSVYLEDSTYEDFRNRLIVTIDGEDAKDFDDAVEVTRLDDGYEVGVHIADVTHYVTYDSPLDREALSRGTSIYVADRVVPMLPFELSNGICSLNPNVERLVQSAIFKVDFEGNIVESRITHGVMKSKVRLTYTYVNKLLGKEKIEKHFPQAVDELIYLLDEVARKIRKKRVERGAIELDTTEIRFVLDKEGNPVDVVKRVQGEGEKLIEDLMIAANEVVATTISNMKLPSIYRIHEQPQAKKMEIFMKLSAHLGYKCNFSALTVTPKELQEHLNKIRDPQVHSVLSMMLLRSLAKARYLEDNKGHYGLASECYTHFTSPIRRYPDLLLHRLVDRYILDKNYEFDINLENEIAFIAENSSIKERRAMAIEREVDDLESSKFMVNKIGEKFSGFINGMTSNGMFVELDNFGIDGFVDYEDIQDDYYVFDEKYMKAYGRRTKHQFALGDRVDVVVSRVDLESYQISFELVTESKMTKVNNKKKREFERKYGKGKRKGHHK